MTLLEQLEISINMANYIKEETQEGIDVLLDNALSRDELGEWVINDEHELSVYSLANVYVDKVLILEVASILEKGIKKMIKIHHIRNTYFRKYQLLTVSGIDLSSFLDLVFNINNMIKHGGANNNTVDSIRSLELNKLMDLGYSDLQLSTIFENSKFIVSGVDFGGVLEKRSVNYSDIKFHNTDVEESSIDENEMEYIYLTANLIKLIGIDIIKNPEKFCFFLMENKIEPIQIPLV